MPVASFAAVPLFRPGNIRPTSQAPGAGRTIKEPAARVRRLIGAKNGGRDGRRERHGDRERDGKGRFAKGNPGGPGRPPRASEANYLLAVTDVVTVDRWRWIVEFVAGQADKGDLKAAAWIAKLVLGANPGRLSEALAGVLHDGPHYRVAEELERKEKEAEEELEDDFDAEDRRERVEAMVKTIGEPDEGLDDGQEDGEEDEAGI